VLLDGTLNFLVRFSVLVNGNLSSFFSIFYGSRQGILSSVLLWRP
jgi:hypothetical protein